KRVLRCGVFLVDIKEFGKMNAAYSRMFGEHRPARTTVQVAALPGEGLRVEIDAVAYVPAKSSTTDATASKRRKRRSRKTRCGPRSLPSCPVTSVRAALR